MRVNTNPRLPDVKRSNEFTASLMEILRRHAYAINDRHEGTSAPTTEKWDQGNFVWNTSPTEQGSVGSKYVVIGYICVSAGEPGTWKECRCLTGG